MIDFHKVQTEDDIQIFVKLKVELVQYHAKYARKRGIVDAEINEYNYEHARKHIFDRESFLLKLNNIVIGILQIEKQQSEVDNNPILYVHALYFCEKYRDKGLGIHVLKYLCNTFRLRIECLCWYGIPASNLYQKVGFENMYTRYFLPLDNRFYDSDQN